MILISDGNSEHAAHASSKNVPKNHYSRYEQISQNRSNYRCATCAPISELPSNISTICGMDNSGYLGAAL